MREYDDKVANDAEPEHKAELASIKELDQLSQLNLLFKTSEILGQILKCRYGWKSFDTNPAPARI